MQTIVALIKKSICMNKTVTLSFITWYTIKKIVTKIHALESTRRRWYCKKRTDLILNERNVIEYHYKCCFNF